MLHAFWLFIYKRQLPFSPSSSALPQTGTRFLGGREVVDFFVWVLKERLDQEGGDFMVLGFGDEK